MNVTIFEPVREALTLQEAMNRLVERRPHRKPLAARVPIDVIETAEAVVVKASLPGCDKDDIEISFREGTLTIRARAAQTSATEHERILLHERAHGEMARTIAVHVAVDADRATAGYTDGILTLTLPKAVAARSHRINVS